MNQVHNNETQDSEWKSLYKVGGVAALIAGVLFRRNISAEIGLFGLGDPPVTVIDWFDLLQRDRLLGLAYLNIFDILNYTLVALMLLALYIALRRANKSYMLIAVTLGIIGITVYFASNPGLSMLSLSERYVAETSETGRIILLGAGEAMLATSRFTSPGALPGSGGYISLLLVALAVMIISSLMLRSGVFNRWTATVGILAAALDLAYCIGYVFLPASFNELLGLAFIPAAGLFYMIWHIMVGVRLLQLGRKAKTSPELS
jgi:hypothetical protein